MRTVEPRTFVVLVPTVVTKVVCGEVACSAVGDEYGDSDETATEVAVIAPRGAIGEELGDLTSGKDVACFSDWVPAMSQPTRGQMARYTDEAARSKRFGADAATAARFACTLAKRSCGADRSSANPAPASRHTASRTLPAV